MIKVDTLNYARGGAVVAFNSKLVSFEARDGGAVKQVIPMHSCDNEINRMPKQLRIIYVNKVLQQTDNISMLLACYCNYCRG
jgi:hypothetical protein